MSSILVIDDHPLYRAALVQLLQLTASIHYLVLPFGAVEDALKASGGGDDVHLIVLDQQMPGLSGAEAVSRFRHSHPTSPIVVVSGSDDRIEAMSALRAGAAVVISKGISPPQMIDVFRRAITREAQPAQWIVATGAAYHYSDDHIHFTDRQEEILGLLIDGYSNKEIALRLGLAEITVKMHVTKLLRMLNVASRMRAAAAARHLGIARSTPIN